MPKLLTPADVTPEQLQVIHKVVTLIDCHSFFADYGEPFDNRQEPCRLQATAIQNLGCAALYQMELRLGTALLGVFVFAVIPLDTPSLWDERGPDDTETLPAHWSQLATTHQTYAIQRLYFLRKNSVPNPAAVDAFVCQLKQELQRQGGRLAPERFSQLLEREMAVAANK
jgi:hypothetical protein